MFIAVSPRRPLIHISPQCSVLGTLSGWSKKVVTMKQHVFNHRAFQRVAARVTSLLCLTLLSLATQVYPQSAVPTFPNPGKTSMSRDNQHALGMEVAAQVYQEMPVLPDNSPESQYVGQLGQKLVATIPSSIRGLLSSMSFRKKRSMPSRSRVGRCSSISERSRRLGMKLSWPGS